jgi:hypothetical protein
MKEREKGEGKKNPFPLSHSISYREATNNDIPSIANVIALAFEEHRGKLEPLSSSLLCSSLPC